jgi:hypothetical protein
VNSNLEKEKKLYVENQKKYGDNGINIEPTTSNTGNKTKIKKTFTEYSEFEKLFNTKELEYLKNVFLTYSSDEVFIL